MIRALLILSSVFVVFFSYAYQPNNPHQIDNDNTLYTVFTERPKHLDPAKAYSASEYVIIAQIYEPPFQYNYLKRPYVLEPLTAVSMPEIIYKDKDGKMLPNDAPNAEIATSSYVITIKPAIYYAAHPGFAKSDKGDFLLYENLSLLRIDDIYSVYDFEERNTRELKASDYVYEIKRLANPKIHSPIAGIMSGLIVGFAQFQKKILNWSQLHPHKKIDLREFNLEGVKLLSEYTYEITIKGKYPQFLYWLAMPFFSPMPWE
ncbi:MAG: oligopeptide transport system substrate-binding protein, partial [Francisellaceae bacterium]